MRKVLAIVVLLCVLPGVATAHGLARYVSTPITPPSELVWVLPAYAVVFIIVTTLMRKREVGVSNSRALLLSMVLFACFAGSFYLIGASAARATTAPPPGLGPPYPVFRGIVWKRAWPLFSRWNLYGIFFLAGWSLAFFKPWHRANRRRWRLILVNVGLYCLCLVPYAADGAWLHGWAGGYVSMICEGRLRVMNEAFLEYARLHNGKLPTADGVESLLEQLSPHLPESIGGRYRPLDSCYIATIFEPQPRRHVWDTSFSGVNLMDIDPDTFLEGKVPVSCPYREHIGIQAALDLRRGLLEMKREQDAATIGRGDFQ
jgi:uncharacterized membrane protein YgdD (TMEM256/DUF423 family)